MFTITKKIRLMAALSGAVLAASPVSAITYRDIDNPNKTLIAGDAFNSTYTGTFNLVTGDGEAPMTIGSPYALTARGTFADIAGFTPGSMEAVSGKVSFWIRDDDALTTDGSESYEIALNDLGNVLSTGSNFGRWKFQSSGLGIDLLLEINTRGQLQYFVTAMDDGDPNTVNDFILDYAMLQINAEPVTGVPDGGATALLFGFGMVGLGSLRLRRK